MTMIKLNDEKIDMIEKYFGLYYGEFPEFMYLLPERHPYIKRIKDRRYKIDFPDISYFEKLFIEENNLPGVYEFRKLFEEDSTFRGLFFPES